MASVAGRGVSYEAGTLLRDSDGVIVLCEAHRSVLAAECPSAQEKLHIIPPAPNIVIADDTDQVRSRGRQSLGVHPSEFLIAFLGYVYPKKGIETLLTAFAAVRRERPQARLVFIGGTIDIDVEMSRSYWDRVQQLCRELDLGDSTVWTGRFDPSQDAASTYLRAADVCVLPLGKGLQLNNSSFSTIAAHGLPLISTQSPTTDRVFVNDENVLLCQPENATEMASAIRRTMDDPSLRAKLRSGITDLARRLSWDELTARTMELLSDTSRGRANAGASGRPSGRL